MFDSITKNFNNVFSKIRSKRFLTDTDLETAARDIRLALLEADVSLPIIKDFIKNIKEKFIGQQVIKNIQPGDMVVKIVNDELINIFGDEIGDINLEKNSILILMMGLQGSGKTTTSAKLANRFKNKFNKKVLLVSLDIYRPAAQEQLEVLAEQIGIDSLEIIQGQKPLDICKRALFLKNNYDIIIFDTAGRLSVDKDMMNELHSIKEYIKPTENILVADSLSGQDAVNTAKEFNEKIGINSVILTRIDGDGRGGAAISLRVITGCPIRYVGIGEKITDFDLFHPKRMVSRILDMGDIISLVEKAEEIVNKEDVEKFGKKISTGEFDFNDLLNQIKMMKKFGGLTSILNFLPGATAISNLIKDKGFDDNTIKKQEAIISSMTKKERKHPEILNSSRKLRIASGSGSTIQEINSLLKKFKEMKIMAQKIGKMDKNQMKNIMKSLNGFSDNTNSF